MKVACGSSLIAADNNTVTCSAANGSAKYLSFVGTEHPSRCLPVTRGQLDIYNASSKQP